MKIKIFLILSMIIHASSVLSQNMISGTVVDNTTNESLAFVNIGLVSKPEGTYTNSIGNFSLNITDSDSLIFSHIGYEKIVVSTIPMIKNDSIIIRLKPKEFQLNEIVISSKKTNRSKLSTKKLGYLKNEKPIKLSIGSPGIQFAEYIPNSFGLTGMIQKISLRLISNSMNKIRLNIYSTLPNGIGGPQESVLREDVVLIMNRNRGILQVDISNQELPFPKEGVFVSVEFMGNMNEHQELLPRDKDNPISSQIFTGKGTGQNRTWSNIHNRIWSVYYISSLKRTNVLIGIEIGYDN